MVRGTGLRMYVGVATEGIVGDQGLGFRIEGFGF